MGGVGKNRRQRQRVRVKTSSSAKKAPSTSGEESAILTAAYIAQMSGELRLLAKNVNLAFLSHLLAMVEAEAAYVAESEG